MGSGPRHLPLRGPVLVPDGPDCSTEDVLGRGGLEVGERRGHDASGRRGGDVEWDEVGGRADLEARCVRTIGSPAKRFGEDRLRLLRAVRFASQLGFEIAPGTFAAVQDHAAAIREVSAERIRDELLKLFRPPHAARGLDLLHESRLLPEVLPELASTFGCEQPPEYHPEGDVFTHIRFMLSQLPADAGKTLIWSVLMHDIAKPATQSRDEGRIRFLGHEKVGAVMTLEIMNRLRFPKSNSAEVETCVRHHMQLKEAQQMRPATLRKLFLRPTFPVELTLHRLDSLASSGKLDNFEFLESKLAEVQDQPELQKPLVDGGDLIALGQARSGRRHRPAVFATPAGLEPRRAWTPKIRSYPACQRRLGCRAGATSARPGRSGGGTVFAKWRGAFVAPPSTAYDGARRFPPQRCWTWESAGGS